MVYTIIQRGFIYNIFEYGSNDYKLFISKSEPSDHKCIFVECRTGMTSVIKEVYKNDIVKIIDHEEHWEIYETAKNMEYESRTIYEGFHKNISEEAKLVYKNTVKIQEPHIYKILTFVETNLLQFLMVLFNYFKKKKNSNNLELNSDESVLYSLLKSQKKFVNEAIDKFIDSRNQFIDKELKPLLIGPN